MEWLLVSDGMVWVFQKLLIYWDFHTQPSLGFTEYPESSSCVDENALLISEVRGEWGRLFRDDRKTTVTQITTRYNQDLQNTISEHTTRWTLKQMSYSSRRPHRVPLLSAKNRKRRIQFTQTHQNWTIEDWKDVAWSDESRFLLQYSDVGSEFDVKNMKSWIYPAFLNGSGCWWWCNGVGDIVLAHLVPIEHRLNSTAYLSIVADVHPFMTTVYPSSDATSSRIMHRHRAQIISDWFLEHDNEFTLLKWPPQSPDLNPIEHLWDVVEREIHIMDVQPTNLQQLRDAIMSICFQYLFESMPRRIKTVMKTKGGVKSDTSKVYLINLSVSVRMYVYIYIYIYIRGVLD